MSEAAGPGRRPEYLTGVFGPYTLDRKLGSGAFGSVYLAHDLRLDRTVALKVPHLHAAPDPEAARRAFQNEARSAAALRHPNICTLFEIGEAEGLPYLTMEYVDGPSLADRLAPGPMDARSACELARTLALALAAAHRQGVVHRDLKPANVMFDADGRPVVMDFGLARRDRDPAGSAAGGFVGTPAYMAPEQLDPAAGDTGPAADLYSLGALLYETLTGRPPYTGSVFQILEQVRSGTGPPPLPAGLPPDLVVICQTLLARKPADRFARMEHVAAKLADAVREPTPRPAEKPPEEKPAWWWPWKKG